MGNRYFFQYLLNEGVLSADDAKKLLSQLPNVKPALPVRALVKRLITAGQLAGMSASDDAGFSQEAKDKHLLTASQIENLQKGVSSRDACVAQCLIDDGRLNYRDLEKYLADYAEKSKKEGAVVTAVMSRAKDAEEHPEYMALARYAEMFIMSVHRFIGTDAVILHEIPEVPKHGWLVSQSLNGGVILTAGVKAADEEFLELGRRFSGEELTEIDDLAVDCVAEFLNEINGLYIVNLSQQDMEVDLGEPRSGEDALPETKGLQAFTVATEFGDILLCMSDSEFIF